MEKRLEKILNESCQRHEVPNELITDIVKTGLALFEDDSIPPSPLIGTPFNSVAEFVQSYKRDHPSGQQSKDDEFMLERKRHAESGDMEAYRTTREKMEQ